MKYFAALALLVLASCGPQNGQHLTVASKAQAKLGAGGVNYDDDVKPVFAKYCSACHPVASRPGTDWMDYNQAKAYALSGVMLRRVVQEKSMPQLGSPQAAAITDKDRALIGAWIQAGAPQKAAASNTSGTAAGPNTGGWPAPPAVVQQCLQCHGPASTQAKIPRLTGQRLDYIVAQLNNFKWRDRRDPSDTMNDIASLLTDAQIQDAAQYFSSLKMSADPGATSASVASDPSYQRGLKRATSDCVLCHMNSDFGGSSSDPSIPVLAGQKQRYLLNQLIYFRDDERHNDIMNPMVHDLTNQDFEDLSLYFSHQP